MYNTLKRKIALYRLKDKSYSYLYDFNIPNKEYIVLDTETTGLNPNQDEILSIGAVKIKNNKIIAKEFFEIFIKPKKFISQESILIHHIRPSDIENGVDINDALKKLLPFIKNLPIIGYYISFDINILNNYLKQYLGVSLTNKQIEVSTMYYERFKKTSHNQYVDLKFDTIMTELNIPILGKHDALNDAIMTAMIFLKLDNLPKYKGVYS
jgi:DNA polymerase-3 subunit epsilon